MTEAIAPVRVRRAELVAALSLGIDLGFGQPMEHVLRQCLIALRLAEFVGLEDDARAAVYYSALLVNVGCHSDAHEQAKWFGDDIALKHTKYDSEMIGIRSILPMLRRIGAGNPPLHRVRVGIEFALGGHRDVDHMVSQHAALARRLGEMLGLSAATLDALGASYERWDGKGWPGEAAGDAIPIAARIIQLSEFVEVAHRTGGVDAALAMARGRAGSQFDPALVDALASNTDDILGRFGEVDTWDAVISAEPALAVTLGVAEFEAALNAIASFVDVKSPYMVGHSQAVSELAAAAGAEAGFDAGDVALLRRAGLVHGFGRLGVSNAIWDKAAPLGVGEWERVRMWPYFTERMLQQSGALAPLGRIAVQHRERMDGSGYPRGLPGSSIVPAARVLGVADAYQAMREPRPYRPARDDHDAARELANEVKAGRLDGDAVEAVLVAAGQRVPRRREYPAGLTTREVEVLKLLTRGLTTKKIATELVISPKTAGNHIEHIYTKIGVNNRAAAALFAVNQGLLPD